MNRLLAYLFPQTLSIPDSSYNKNISIQYFCNTTTLVVDGLIESGKVMTDVWTKAIKSFLPRSFKPRRVLLLGLAGGCNARLINRFFPQANIVSVEIDPQMVEIGKKYFRLNRVKRHQIVIADALEYVNSLTSENTFDVVLVDCFVGQDIPQKLQTVAFLQKLTKHCRYVLINRLWWSKYKSDTLRFFRSISPHFFFIKARTASNVIISLA